MPTQGESPVACLLLAAGASHRMGRDKLTLPFGAGSTVLEATALALSRAPVTERLLVTRGPLAFDASALGFEVIEIGAEADAGMHRSLKRGLARLSNDPEAVMVCLGDQPFLRTEDYANLIDAYQRSAREGFDLLYPTREGRRGNPAVLHRRYFTEIFAEPDSDRGCRYLFDRYPDRVRAWEPASRNFFLDLDTPEDYRACLN